MVDEAVLVTVGVGKTVTVLVNVVPVQPFADGVMMYSMVTGAELVFTSVSVIGFADWFDTDALEMPAIADLLQVNVVPATADVMV